jgi:hypothetical protein
MKLQTRLFFPLFIVGSFSLVTATVGCKKSNSSSGGTAMSASLGSTNFSSANSVGFYSTDSALFELAGFAINAGDSNVLQLVFSAPLKLNVPMSSGTSNTVDVEYFDTKNTISYGGGVFAGMGHSIVNVTAWDSANHKITGTITGVLYNESGTGTDSLILSNGKFSSTYFVEP